METDRFTGLDRFMGLDWELGRAYRLAYESTAAIPAANSAEPFWGERWVFAVIA